MHTISRITLNPSAARPAGHPEPRSAWSNRALAFTPAACLLLCVLPGCLRPHAPSPERSSAVAVSALPILQLRPDANWTACYNRLIDEGPAAIRYLAESPALQTPAAPDDLRVMLHLSLLRLLANPATAPRLSVRCFETTLEVLYLDPKVQGRKLGTLYLAADRVPVRFHDLYPAHFDHDLAARIDVEADRQVLLRWWHYNQDQPRMAAGTRSLHPRPAHLWPLLKRRRADSWEYSVEPTAITCAAPPPNGTLLRLKTSDYNLTRAACIWLAQCGEPDVERELIRLIGHSSPTIAYNARFALERSGDARIRDVLRRYKQPAEPAQDSANGPRVVVNDCAIGLFAIR